MGTPQVGPSGVWVGPIGGAEYRDADRDLPKPYRAVVNSPESFVAILHFINTRSEEDVREFECPCQPYRNINIANGTVDGVKPLPFHCSEEMLFQQNPACKLEWYTGGYRCCEHGSFVSRQKQLKAPMDWVVAKFTITIDDVLPETRPAFF